ncbi:hypothetical protein FRC07_004623 [Ceratobasidium sp. 392]|nr:hypothetical protein FRC07_004623 [Ceratobasidium sp. 392]
MPSSRASNHHDQYLPTTSSTGSKRKAESPTETTSANPNSGTTPTKKPRDGAVADTSTPRYLGSAQRTKEGSGNSVSASRPSRSSKFRTTDATHSRTSNTLFAIPETPRQFEMDRFLESEMKGAIFCDPNFVKNFFGIDSPRLQTVLQDCESDLDAVRFEERVTRERQLYEPLRKVLNIIKAAVDGTEDLDETGFLDVSADPITAHYDDMAGIKPDLALFESAAHHWETVRMPIEVKRQATYLKTGMKQLTRYARAVFAHQLHRRHLYGMVVCKWAATFVRFDRSGILYSKPIDVRGQDFRQAFAGLMMLGEEAFGYDTAFTTRPRRDGRLDFYVDLPADAFPTEEKISTTTYADPDAIPNTSSSTAGAGSSLGRVRKLPTRRLKVMERLCHRKSIRGRATIVLRVREVIQPGALVESEETKEGIQTRSQTKQAQLPPEELEILGTQDYVLKLMWRDPNKRMEGEVLERLVGIYGVAQHIWHSDVFKSCGSSDCGKSSVCGNCVDRTPDRNRVWVTKNLTDIDIEIPEEAEGGQESQYKAVQTDEYSEAYAQRPSRIYCRLLMATVGTHLCTAENPRDLLKAVLDAVLGYWGIVNKGLLHRDISDGNVLMLQEGCGYRKREWKEQQDAADGEDMACSESEELLRDVLKRLGRDPSGILNDFDLFTTHSQMGAAFFGESTEDEESGRGMKRRKLDSTAIDSSSPIDKSEKHQAPESQESSLNHIVNAAKGVCQGIDFRTGTPTFMSKRVLKVPVGQRYEHSFMDDLESFFWLVLWCVVEHVDGPRTGPQRVEQTQGAVRVLNLLDQSNLDSIATTKGDLMADCFRDNGDAMKSTLASCKNSWAADPMVVKLILKLGVYFFGISYTKIFKYKPAKVFPELVKMIMDAFDQPDVSSSDSESE